jgi:nitroreductase
MDTIEAITKRRSIRKYKSEKPSKEVLLRLLDCARWAPSWANTQCTRYIVIEDPDIKRKLSELMPAWNPAIEAVRSAPYVVAFYAKLGVSGYKKGVAFDERDWYMFDVALAVQNFCLSAHSLGLATVQVGAFDFRAASKVLNLPEGFELVLLCPLGYPASVPRPPSRIPLEELISYNRVS